MSFSERKTRDNEMSIMLYALLFETYGPRMNTEALSKALGYTVRYVQKLLVNGDFPVRAYKDGASWYCDTRDVAQYLDTQREKAA